MLNNKENTLPTWIFFSNVDATQVNESGRLLAGTENLLDVLVDGDHRLAAENVVKLIGLLGACVASNPTPHPSVRELFTDCVMILSRKLAELPREEV